MVNSARIVSKLPVLALFGSLFSLIALLLVVSPSAHADPGEKAVLDIDPTKPIVVSMGDSYSSGEGCPPFYGSRSADPNTGELRDWVAHRSADSWPGRLRVGSGLSTITLSDCKDENWFFVASSGAESDHIYSRRQKKEYAGGVWSKETILPKQDYICSAIAESGYNIDYVTLTIGGNDVGFASAVEALASARFTNRFDLLKKVLQCSWKKYYSGYNKKNGEFERPAEKTIVEAYQDIREKAGNRATIIVAGYPMLVAERKTATWNKEDAILLNKNVHMFNEKLNALVDQVAKDEGGKTGGFVFADVEQEFCGAEHGAYSDDSWINEILLFRRSNSLEPTILSSEDLGPFTPVSDYSMHPNRCSNTGCAKSSDPNCGISAYAIAVQKKIDGLAGAHNGRIEESNPRQLDLSNRELCKSLNKYLSEFGMSDKSYFDLKSGEWVSVSSWNHGELPKEYLIAFATSYCSLFEPDFVESSPNNDWGVGQGASAQNTCNRRVKTAYLNQVLERYFDVTIDFQDIDQEWSRAIDGYYYWGITAPPSQGRSSLSIVTGIEADLGGNIYRIGFDYITAPGLLEPLNDRDRYYSMNSKEAHSVDGTSYSAFGSALIAYKPDNANPFEILGWSVVW